MRGLNLNLCIMFNEILDKQTGWLTCQNKNKTRKKTEKNREKQRKKLLHSVVVQ